MQQRTWTWWAVGLACALIVGAGLRLIWVNDMEYKYDECWVFLQTQPESRTHDKPWVGMESSAGVLNAGMSLWIFEAAAKVFGVDDPTELARVVQWASIVAMLVMVGFALWAVPNGEREAWLWAVALLALNPTAVMFHRKIWTPSSLPIFMAALLIGWWYRERRAGAFVWGLIAAALGQIQGTGFFFAAGFFAWAFLFDRKRVAWLSWFVGSCLGALPMIPWIWCLLTMKPPHQTAFTHKTWVHIFELKYWTRFVTDPLGWGLTYPFREDVMDFLAYPEIGGRATYFVAFLQVLVVTAGLVLLWRVIEDWREERYAGVSLWDRLIGRHSPTAFTLGAALWGFGLVMTLTCLPLHRHYMVTLFILEFVWMARVALGPTTATTAAEPNSDNRLRFGRVFLTTVCLLQLVMSATFLVYVHTHQGTLGDYGPTYSSSENRYRPLRVLIDPSKRWQ